jgi:hypothetical protein
VQVEVEVRIHRQPGRGNAEYAAQGSLAQHRDHARQAFDSSLQARPVRSAIE